MAKSKRRATVSRGSARVHREGWQASFHLALLDYIVRHGELVSETYENHGYGEWQERGPWKDDYSGTLPHALAVHVRDVCAIDPGLSSYTDSEWNEFLSSRDGWEDHAGLDAVIYCRCGLVAGRHWRYTNGYATLLRGITGG
jgi:hypothetical protein